MAHDVRREILEWEQFGAAGQELASTVVEDGYRPDLLLAIARGGLLIAGAMSYALGMKNCCVINVEYQLRRRLSAGVSDHAEHSLRGAGNRRPSAGRSTPDGQKSKETQEQDRGCRDGDRHGLRAR